MSGFIWAERGASAAFVYPRDLMEAEWKSTYFIYSHDSFCSMLYNSLSLCLRCCRIDTRRLLSFRLKHEEDVYVKYLLTEMCGDNII